MSFKLCFIDEGWAYFTTKEVTEQWGDDWDDAPYEHNAGTPYEDDDNEIKQIYFELPNYYHVPCTGYTNSPYAVEDINKGVVAWLWTDNFKIFAGTTIEDFIKIIQDNNGKIYAELKN